MSSTQEHIDLVDNFSAHNYHPLPVVIEKAQGEVDSANRHSLYHEVEEVLRREALVLPLQHLPIWRLCRPEVTGLELSYTTPFVSYETLRLVP